MAQQGPNQYLSDAMNIRRQEYDDVRSGVMSDEAAERVGINPQKVRESTGARFTVSETRAAAAEDPPVTKRLMKSYWRGGRPV